MCLVHRDLSIFLAAIWLSSFCIANVGLTFGGIYTCPEVVLIRYAPYILALQVHYVHYMLACNAKSLSSF